MIFSNLKLNSKISQRGFTLLEMTIALGIFVVLITLTLGIYSSSLKAERRTVQISKLQQEAQLIMEIIAKEIRSSKVDYAFYPGSVVDPVNGQSQLALLDKSGHETVFRFNSSNDALEVCTQNCAGSGVFTAIPPQDVVIQDLTFFITPAANPFSLDAPPAEFPKVTMVMTLSITHGVITQDLLIQQTIPQRLGGI